MKKNLLFLMLALIACAFGARADELTVMTGRTTTNEYVPLNGYYYDTGFKNTMIYPAELLGNMQGGIINSISFYANSDFTALSGGSMKVSIGEVDVATPSGHFTEGLTEVFNGVPGKDGVKCVITFNTPFEYNGGNLAIECYLTSKGSNCPHIYFYGEEIENASYYSYGSYSGNKNLSFLPEATFDYDAPSSEEFAAKITPNDKLEFGTVPSGSQSTLNVVLRNTGLNAFTPTVTVSGDAFSTTYTSAELASKTQVNIPVVFSPTAPGDYTGSLSIDCGNNISFTLPLTGSSVNALIVSNGTTSNQYLPVYGNFFEADQINQMIYPYEMVKGLEGKQIKSMTFYPQNGINFYKTSTTAGAITFSLGNLDANTPEYAISPVRQEGYEPVATIVMPEEKQPNLTEWTITFDEPFVYEGGDLLLDIATDHGYYGSTYFFGSNQQTNQSYYSYNTTKQRSTFLPKVKFVFEDAAPVEPVYSMEVTSSKAIDCGSVIGAGNAVATEKLVVKNTGNQPVKPVITLSGDNAGMFTIDPAEAAELAPRKSAEYTITFTAPEGTEAGEYTANVAITDDNGNAAAIEDVTVKGTVVAPVISGTVTPETLEFTIPAEKTTTGTITIANTGNTAFTPVFSALEAPFSIDEATEIAAGASKVYTITYAPTVEGTNEATLNVTIGTQEPVAVTLNGVATEPTSEVVVCDKTNTNPYIPFYSFWADTYLVESQFIYPAEKLTGLNGRKITGIKFFAETNVKATGGKLQISLKETDQTVFATYAGEDKVTEMTIAGTSVPSNSTNELEFIFNEPIAYNGGNLAIEVIALEKSTNCDKTYWLGESQSSTTATSYYAYGNYGGLQYFLPKAEFGTIAGGGPVEEEITLAELCRSGVITEGENEYTIKDQLIGVYADDVKGILWCKDQGNASIFSTSILDGQVDFLKDDPQAQNGRDWDQSNWIALHFSTPTATNNIGQLVNGAVNRYIKPGTVKGKLIDDVNYALRMDLDQLELVTQADDPDINPDYIPNVYCPANFMPDNLNIHGGIENGDGGYTGNPQINTQNYFFMNPKIQEICEVTYAQWDAINGYFTVPTASGFDGAFYIGTGYNVIQSQNFTNSLQDEHIYKFKAIVQRSDKDNYGPKNVTNPATGITLYPVDLDPASSEIPTAINTVNVNGEVKSVKYYNVAGIESDVPFEGVNIEVTTYEDGSRASRKIMK